MVRRLTAVCENLARDILSGPVINLCREVEREIQALIDIVTGAAHMALELWIQRTYMECLDITSFGKFNNGSTKMEAHRLQKLDDDDNRLDGHEVVAVIQPALITYGDDNGENYEDGKVWSKALVLAAEE